MDTRPYCKTPPPKNGGRSALYFIPFGVSDVRQSTEKKKWLQNSNTKKGGRSVQYVVLLGGLGNPAEYWILARTPKPPKKMAGVPPCILYLLGCLTSGRVQEKTNVVPNFRKMWAEIQLSQLQSAKSPRTVDGLLHQKSETYREDSSYREGGRLAQWMEYYINRAGPTERQLQKRRSTRRMDVFLPRVGKTYSEDSS